VQDFVEKRAPYQVIHAACGFPVQYLCYTGWTLACHIHYIQPRTEGLAVAVEHHGSD
jgi:hypothetical protein